jgi:uncharacterized protein (TIGR02611 family)
MDKAGKAFKRIHPTIRKPLVFIAGAIVILAGAAMLVLPGPGWIAIFLGLAILATEFVFAQKARDWLVVRLKQAAQKAKRSVRRGAKDVQQDATKHKHQ